MKCPTCGVWTRTLETRNHEAFNYIWRRKECANLHTFTTIEQSTDGPATRPPLKNVVAVRSGRSQGLELDAPVHRRNKDSND
jgi:hypothetical protein